MKSYIPYSRPGGVKILTLCYPYLGQRWDEEGRESSPLPQLWQIPLHYTCKHILKTSRQLKYLVMSGDFQHILVIIPICLLAKKTFIRGIVSQKLKIISYFFIKELLLVPYNFYPFLILKWLFSVSDINTWSRKMYEHWTYVYICICIIIITIRQFLPACCWNRNSKTTTWYPG